MPHASNVHSTSSSKEEEYLAGWRRARAELETYRRLVAEQKDTQKIQIKRQVIEPLLTIADHFNSLAEHVPPELEKNSWAQGVLHIARGMQQLLEEYGLTQIGMAGEPFDPRRHEAVEEIDSDEVASGAVVSVIQPGYMLSDQLVRPARVTIAK